MRSIGRVILTPLIIVLAIAGGAGWLELLRRSGALAAGPRISGALPLDRLAGHDAQPLVRVLAAWIPAGLAAAFAMRAATGWSRATRAVVTGIASFVLVFLLGGLADAITASDPLGSHFSAQWHHDATWLVPLVLAACALMLGRSTPWRSAPAPERDATRPGRGAPAAA
jgi:hypothetical protein